MGESLPKVRARHIQIVRQWKVLLAFDAHRRGLTFAELRTAIAKDAAVSERTLRRDIDALSLAGFPIDVETRGASSGQSLVVLDRSQWRSGSAIFTDHVAHG